MGCLYHPELCDKLKSSYFGRADTRQRGLSSQSLFWGFSICLKSIVNIWGYWDTEIVAVIASAAGIQPGAGSCRQCNMRPAFAFEMYDCMTSLGEQRAKRTGQLRISWNYSVHENPDASGILDPGIKGRGDMLDLPSLFAILKIAVV